MKIGNKFLSVALLGILTLVIFASAVSADILEFQDISAPTSANPGTDVIITFNLNHTGLSLNNQTGLIWTGSSLNKGTFRQLPSLDRINVGETKALSAVITIPRNASGSVTANIKVESSSATANFTKTITINDLPSLIVSKTKEITQTQNGTIQLENNGNTVLGNIVLSSSGSLNVEFSENPVPTLAIGEKKLINVIATDLTNLGVGGKSATITATHSTGGSVSGSVTFNVPGSFCSAGQKGGNLSFSEIKITNNGEGEDNEWKLMDDVEVKVEVENIGDDDVNSVKVVLGLFDSAGKNKINDLIFENSDEETIDLGRINDGDEETATFTFKVPADMKDGDYKLVVKAYSSRTGQNKECVDSSSDLSDDNFESISVIREDDEGKFIAFEDIVLSPSEATCGDRITLNANVFNIGDEDQDQVKVNLYSKDLKISQNVELKNNLDTGDSQAISFEFEVPTGIADKNYDLQLSSEYDYNNGNYRQGSDEATFVRLKVLGCSEITPGSNSVSISAALESAAKAGEEITVKATISNLKNSAVNLVVDSKNYQDWATLGTISPRVLSLAAGASQEVTIKLNANSDSSGEQSFDIDVLSGTEVVGTREVGLNIAGEDAGVGVGGAFSGLGNNTYLWIIGAVNVILIILIIAVAIRISRR